MTANQSNLDTLAILEAVHGMDVPALRTILDDCDHEAVVWALAALTLGMGTAVFHKRDDPAQAFLSSVRSQTDMSTGEFLP